MPGRLRTGSATTRRRFLTTLASASAATIAAPAFSLSPQRPIVTHGVQSGDVSVDSGMVWARADRPARMLIEAATTDSFKEICHASVVDALPETDFTAKALIEDLPPGQDIFYRLRFQDLWSAQAIGEPSIGPTTRATSPRSTSAKIAATIAAPRPSIILAATRPNAPAMFLISISIMPALPSRFPSRFPFKNARRACRTCSSTRSATGLRAAMSPRSAYSQNSSSSTFASSSLASPSRAANAI